MDQQKTSLNSEMTLKRPPMPIQIDVGRVNDHALLPMVFVLVVI